MATKKRATKKRAGRSEEDALSVLRRLPAATEANPDHGVADILHEARDLEATLGRLGAELIAKSDLPKDAVSDLRARIALLDRTEAEWLAVRKQETPKELVRARAEAEHLHREARAALRYFGRDDPRVQHVLEGMANAHDDAQLIMDLSLLAGVAALHAKPLKTALGKAPEKTLVAASETLKELSFSAPGTTDPLPALHLRNRAYWHLREGMDAIRLAGRYVFRADPKRLVLFRSSSTHARLHARPGRASKKTSSASSSPDRSSR